jgi:hypothetical protein
MGPTAQGYRWMNNAISKLDPEKDYETIWRIMTGYKANDFMNNLIYALTFPNFVVTENGARAVWREDGGKVLNKAILREEETDHTNATWWYGWISKTAWLVTFESKSQCLAYKG